MILKSILLFGIKNAFRTFEKWKCLNRINMPWVICHLKKYEKPCILHKMTYLKWRIFLDTPRFPHPTGNILELGKYLGVKFILPRWCSTSHAWILFVFSKLTSFFFFILYIGWKCNQQNGKTSDLYWHKQSQSNTCYRLCRIRNLS